jgi:hypothetical protein
MIVTSYFWLLYARQTASFEVATYFPILANPTSSERPFVANAEEELKFLKLVDEINQLSGLLSSYSTFAGASESCSCVCPAHVSVLPMCLSCQYVCPAHVSVLAGDTATWNITLALLTTSCGIMHASMSLLHSTSLFYHFPKSFPVQSLYLPF